MHPPDDVDARWEAKLRQLAPLLSAFDELRLGFNESDAARTLGVRDVRALRAWLAQQRLPPYRQLRDWYYIVQFVTRFGGENSMTAWALRRGDPPRAYSRFVRQVTGRSWNELKRFSPKSVQKYVLALWTPFENEMGQ